MTMKLLRTPTRFTVSKQLNILNIFKGSLKPDIEISEPSGMTGVIASDCSDTEKIEKIMESDVIIYDIQDCYFDEIEYILNGNYFP